MKPSDEKLVAAFIDGELAGEELEAFEARLEKEPALIEAIEEKAGEFEISGEIREAFSNGDVIAHDMRMAATDLGGIDVPNADAFNSDILARIKGETGGGEISHG